MSLDSNRKSIRFVEFTIHQAGHWDVEAGPSRYEMMIAHWHQSQMLNNPERLELTIRVRSTEGYCKVHIIILSATRFYQAADNDNWKIQGILYPANDPLGIRPNNPSVYFSMNYNVRTRKGTLSAIKDLA